MASTLLKQEDFYDGLRVVVNGEFDTLICDNRVGTIIANNPDGSYNCLVQFDEKFSDDLHDGDLQGVPHNCWWFPVDENKCIFMLDDYFVVDI